MDRTRSIDLICVHSDRTVREWLVHVQVHINKPLPAVYPNGWSYTNTEHNRHKLLPQYISDPPDLKNLPSQFLCQKKIIFKTA